MLTIEETPRIDDKTGRTILRFTPVLHSDCCATGSLRFAYYEIWADVAADVFARSRDKAIADALKNARAVLKDYSEDKGEVQS